MYFPGDLYHRDKASDLKNERWVLSIKGGTSTKESCPRFSHTGEFRSVSDEILVLVAGMPELQFQALACKIAIRKEYETCYHDVISVELRR